MAPRDLSAFAFPPAPERLGGRDTLDKLAEARNDDVLFGGSINPEDVPTGMMAVNEAMQHYTEIYSNVVGIGQPPEEQEEDEDDGAPGVSEVMYGLMSDGDKLNELTKLVSRLRFGIEGRRFEDRKRGRAGHHRTVPAPARQPRRRPAPPSGQVHRTKAPPSWQPCTSNAASTLSRKTTPDFPRSRPRSSPWKPGWVREPPWLAAGCRKADRRFRIDLHPTRRRSQVA